MSALGFCLALLGLALCSESKGAEFVREKMNLMELSARPYLYELSQKYGKNITLATIPDSELQYWVDNGITAIYLLGVWELGFYGLIHDRTDLSLVKGFKETLPDMKISDIIGSTFAVTEYTPNSSEIATEADLLQFKTRINNLGMKLFTDFVPNHAAVDSPLINKYPSLFVKAPPSLTPPYDRNVYLPNGLAYGKDKYGSIWTDTAQFNLWNEDTIVARINDLKTVAKFSDGIRCDMAMLLLNDNINEIWGSTLSQWGYKRPSQEFWKRAISEVKKEYPNVIFMAETYWNANQTLLDQGFDYCYDKEGLYDALSSKSASNVKSYINGKSVSFLQQSTHFVENHDEGRAVAHFGSVKEADAAALVTFLLPGMKFHFMGQWEGKANKLDIHLVRSYSEPESSEAVAFYDSLNTILKDDVWHLGDFAMLKTANDNGALIAWQMNYNGQKVAAIVNYSGSQASGNVFFNGIPTSGTITFDDRLNGAKYDRDAAIVSSEGLTVVLDAWSGHVFYF